MQVTLNLDGFDAGPLFAPVRKVKPPVRPKGKEGVVHRAQTKRATPQWADKHEIEKLYAEARRLTKLTGELHVVDHLVPKISPLVCGLHVHQNMHVIHWRENTLKANLWWPDMWGIQDELF